MRSTVLMELPTEVYFVTTNIARETYTSAAQVKAALKRNRKLYQFNRAGAPFRFRKVPHRMLQVWRGELTTTGCWWQNVTHEFVKDGRWAW